MSCGCVYSEGEPARLLLRKHVKARKSHKCCSCKRIIKKGEKYEYMKSVFEGEFHTDKICLDCLSIIKEFFCGPCCTEMMLYDLEYHLEDIDGQVKSECLEALTPAARSRIIDMIDEIWENE